MGCATSFKRVIVTELESSPLFTCTCLQKSLQLQKKNLYSAGKDMAVAIDHFFSRLAIKHLFIIRV